MSTLDPFEIIYSDFVLVEEENIDTDQILPGRFLTTTERAGMKKFLFYDWRYRDDGSEIEKCVFNTPRAKRSQILVSGANFGCGSSREHAPWALADYGFRVILAPEFADIFKNNTLKNGILPIEIDSTFYNWLKDHPAARISVDLKAKQVRYGDGWAYCFDVDPFARRRMLDGMDEMDFLLSKSTEIADFEAKYVG